MGLRQSACVGALCLAAALLGGRESSLAAQLRIDRLTLSDVLDQYDRGHAESVIARLAALQASDLAPLAIDLLQNGESWIAAGGSALNTRRRRIGATVGLELADAALRLDTASPANRWATWIRVRPAIEWGCVRIRRNSAEQPERLWHLASIALASRAMDTALLLGETGRRGPLSESQHVRHAASQFPNEPRFRLAEAIVSEWPLLNEDTPDRSGTTVENLSPKVLSRPRAQTEKERGKVSRQTVRRQFERLLGVDEVSAEAYLHLGYQRFLDHDSAGALHDFQQAATPGSDPYVRYLALFLAGRMLDRLNQPADAEKSYVLALQALPNVQSGVISLATKWFVAGNTDAAARLVEGSLFTQPDDPWRLFRYGDYRLLPELMKRLRLALR